LVPVGPHSDLVRWVFVLAESSALTTTENYDSFQIRQVTCERLLEQKEV
jgi:hypothetical protein